LVGRIVVIETTDERIYRGTIQSMFELNGERAIHIQTDDGQNLIYTTSQICAACVLYNPHEEEVLSPIPRNDDNDNEDDDNEVVRPEVVRPEVVHIDSDSEDETQRMEIVQIDSDSDSDNDDDSNASTKEYNDDYCMHHAATAALQAAEEEEEEPDCCAICFDITDPARNFVSLNCGHQFHFACIMGNMANGGHNRNQCPMCRDHVIPGNDVLNLDALHQELNLMQQLREDLAAEHERVMGMQLRINARYHEERAARDALERRAYICGLNERIAAVVVNAANNDIRQDGAAVHAERQIRDLCMSFGMMAYDAQYDYQYPEYQYPEYQYPEYPDPEDAEDAEAEPNGLMRMD
jgi:hypothetical protein